RRPIFAAQNAPYLTWRHCRQNKKPSQKHSRMNRRREGNDRSQIRTGRGRQQTPDWIKTRGSRSVTRTKPRKINGYLGTQGTPGTQIRNRLYGGCVRQRVGANRQQISRGIFPGPQTNQEVEKLALLPTEKRKPKQRLEDFSILLYGTWKIGKSTFCSQMDHPLFLATEPGLEALEVYEVKIPDWKTFLQACAEISQGNHPFKTIVIDTVDNLWKACSEYVRDQLDIMHESDLAYGKGYAMVRDEFFRVLRKLSLLPYGLVMTSHVEMMEVKTRTATITK